MKCLSSDGIVMPEVAIIDNFARRQWNHELGAETLTPIQPLSRRLEVWEARTGRRIQAYVGDLLDHAFLLGAILDRFFCEYSAINHFTQTVIRTTERGEIMRWPVRTGLRRPL